MRRLYGKYKRRRESQGHGKETTSEYQARVEVEKEGRLCRTFNNSLKKNRFIEQIHSMSIQVLWYHRGTRDTTLQDW